MKAQCARLTIAHQKLNAEQKKREDIENAKGLEDEWQRRHFNLKDYIEA